MPLTIVYYRTLKCKNLIDAFRFSRDTHMRLAYPKTRIPARETKLALKETLKWNAKKQTFSPQGRVRAPC